MQEYLKNEEMLGGALIVRKDDEIAYKNTWGYADYERTKITDEENIYRMCSMTKPVTSLPQFLFYTVLAVNDVSFFKITPLC